MSKDLLFREDALIKIGIGVNKIAKAVGVTMGPNGQNVIISRGGQMAITKDGVTVAKEVELEDYLENVGSQLIKQIAQKTAFEAGDGTTTSTILAAAIFNAGIDSLTIGVNPIEMKTGMELQVKAIIDALVKRSNPIIKGDTNTLRNIATISANNDKELGDLIATAFETIGFKGVIHPQPSKTSETSIERVS